MKSCGTCTSRMACRTYGCQRAERERLSLRIGEVCFLNWCQDVALGCVCVPHQHQTLDCISIARGVTDEGVEYDRCLGCDAVWTSRDFRWQPARKLRLRERSAA